jgi:hypothetical protein
MKTFIQCRVATLFIAMGLLSCVACGAVAGEEGDLDVEGSAAEGVAATQQPLGSSCKNVDIRVQNSRSYPITVKSVEYYNASEGRWQSEDLTNKTVYPGSMEFWTPNFEYSENDWIYSFNVIYDSGQSYHVNTPDQTCIPGRVFLLEVQ